MHCFHAQVAILFGVVALAVSIAEGVQVCPDDVVELTCISNHTSPMLRWEVTLPGQMNSGPISNNYFMPGINFTVCNNKTDASIVTILTVHTSNFDITDAPINITCTEAGEATTNYTLYVTANSCVGSTTTNSIGNSTEYNILTSTQNAITSASGDRRNNLETGVIAAAVVIVALIVFTTSVIAVVLKRKAKSRQDGTALINQDRHVYVKRNENKQQDQEYIPNHQAADIKEEESELDYATVRGVQPLPESAEYSGGYTLIGSDHSYQQIEKNSKVEYTAVRIETKPEDDLLNLDCLLILIRDVSPEWEQLASELSTPKKEIEFIRKATGGEDYDALVEVCDWWIKQLRERNSQPTWRVMSKALKRIGFPDLAKEMMEIYKTGKLPKQMTGLPKRVPDNLTRSGNGDSEEAPPPPVPPYNASAATPSASAAETSYDNIVAIREKIGTQPLPPSPPPSSHPLL